MEECQSQESCKLLPLKLSLLHGCFSRFSNCANGTKSRKASHFFYHLEIVSQGLSVKKVFLEMLQNPQENTCDGVSF